MKGDAERAAIAQLPDWQKLALEIEASQASSTSARLANLGRACRAIFATRCGYWAGVPHLRMVAIATLALGIGGCTTIFSLIEAVMLRPIDYREPNQLVMVWENQYRQGFHKNVVALADYLDWQARNHVFSDMSPILNQIWNVTGHGEPVVLNGYSVNDRFLPMLGVQPLFGRRLPRGGDESWWP